MFNFFVNLKIESYGMLFSHFRGNKKKESLVKIFEACIKFQYTFLEFDDVENKYFVSSEKVREEMERNGLRAPTELEWFIFVKSQQKVSLNESPVVMYGARGIEVAGVPFGTGKHFRYLAILL